MWIFRILSRCTSTYKLAFRSIIYVWKYPFVIYNHQAEGIWKYFFVRCIFHISKQFYALCLFVLPLLTNQLFLKDLLYTASSVQSDDPAWVVFWGEREWKEKEKERESWWDQFSKWLGLKTVTENKKNYSCHHLKNKKQKTTWRRKNKNWFVKQTNGQAFVD